MKPMKSVSELQSFIVRDDGGAAYIAFANPHTVPGRGGGARSYIPLQVKII
jgi:hypothetical protein